MKIFFKKIDNKLEKKFSGRISTNQNRVFYEATVSTNHDAPPQPVWHPPIFEFSRRLKNTNYGFVKPTCIK